MKVFDKHTLCCRHLTRITARLNAAELPPARHWQPCLTNFVELCATKCGATSATRVGQSRSKWNTGLEAAGGKARPPCPLWVDTVEKRFCGPECATLIQNRGRVRNFDSNTLLFGFDCCVWADR